MPVLTRKCDACGETFQVLERYRRGTLSSGVESRTYFGGERDGEPFYDGCQFCGHGEVSVVIAGVAPGIMLGGEAGAGRFYPRWDWGLGCTVTSEQHRMQLCKERGLRPIEGADIGFAEQVDKERNRQQEEAAAHAEMERQMYEGPEREQYSKARDIIAKYGIKLWEDQGKF